MSSLRLDLLWGTMLFCSLCGDVIGRELCYVNNSTGGEFYCEDLECCGSNPTYCCDKQSFLVQCAVWGSVGVLFIVGFATCQVCKASKSRKKKAAMKAVMEAKMKKTQLKASPQTATTANPTTATANTTATDSANTTATAATVFVISESVSGEGGGGGGVVNQGFTLSEPPEVTGNIATATTTNSNTASSPSATYHHHQQRDGGSSNISSSPPETRVVTDREGRHFTPLVENSPSSTAVTTTTTTTTTTTMEIVAPGPLPSETIYGQSHYPPPATPTLPAQLIHVSESPHTVDMADEVGHTARERGSLLPSTAGRPDRRLRFIAAMQRST